MDLKKLKVDQFNHFLVRNFPDEFDTGIEPSSEPIEVILFFIQQIEDVRAFSNLCSTTDLAKENRVIMVFEKGRKDGVNRDTIFTPFRTGEYSGFKMKAPMLCSLSDKLSAFVQQKVI